jgi:peptidoglycan-associated lipoprotein
MRSISISVSCSFVAALALATGCSHEQKVAAARPTKAPPPVVAERPPAPKAPEEPVASESTKNKEGDAIYFDFDSAMLRDDAHPVLQSVADNMRGQRRSVKIEGNCDELGTVEYNLALGDHRARAAKDYLVRLGVPASHITTLSYGSQRPKDPGHDETAHAKNRRDDFVVE